MADALEVLKAFQQDPHGVASNPVKAKAFMGLYKSLVSGKKPEGFGSYNDFVKA